MTSQYNPSICSIQSIPCPKIFDIWKANITKYINIRTYGAMQLNATCLKHLSKAIHIGLPYLSKTFQNYFLKY